ncbi:NAD(P)-dependent oxidoreductase [Trebonia sp.]|uniref:NAD-dependent epimerase/dehydratase family protein n=1 Tax=Trebonia sp. TaxID=2767075 RepID=UPI00260ABE36|nr:NAD-dependent epimerase/dehydratase family protein [Trebonia sp.]
MCRRSVLVTGAGGFIGSVLVAALLRLGWDVAAVDQDSSRLNRLLRFSGTGNLHAFRVDITSQADIADVVMRAKPTSIVHLAALHLIPVCEAQPRQTVEVNIGGLVNVLDAADRSRTEFVLFASSADVYAASADPAAEGDQARPSTMYGITKLIGERLVSEWADGQPGRRATNMRIFNVYGSGDGNPHVIPDILRHLQQGDEIRVGNVEASRDFIHVDDLVDLLCLVLESSAPPALLNAGTGSATKVSAVLDMIQDLVGRPLTLVSDSARVRANDRICLRADTSQLRSLFPGYDPRHIETGLRDILTAKGAPLGRLRHSKAGLA